MATILTARISRENRLQTGLEQSSREILLLHPRNYSKNLAEEHSGGKNNPRITELRRKREII